jgi:hypothetical protein
VKGKLGRGRDPLLFFAVVVIIIPVIIDNLL